MKKQVIMISLLITTLFYAGCGNKPARVEHAAPDFVSIEKIVMDEIGFGSELFIDRNNIFEVEYNGEKCYLYIQSFNGVSVDPDPLSINITSIMLINQTTNKIAKLYQGDVERSDSLYKYLDNINDRILPSIEWAKISSLGGEKALEYIYYHNKYVRQGGKIN